MKIDLEKLATASREELLSVIELLCAENVQLRAEVEELKRKKARSATPFSKGKGKANPKKPGRKKADGKPVERRGAPDIKPEDEVKQISVVLNEEQKEQSECPDCGGSLEVTIEAASIIDMPQQVRREITLFKVETLRCRQCGRIVARGAHPDLAADQYGATAHRVGARVKALGHLARIAFGVTQCKTPDLLKEVTGIDLSQSALNQDALKHGGEDGLVGILAEIIKEEVQSSAHIHTDDTGWKIGGKRAQLMGFFSEDASYYQIRHKHGAREVAEVIDPEACKFTLNTDRFKTYDAEIFECIVMQKCLSHLQKNLRDQLENKQGRARTFCENLKSLFKQSLELWHRYRAQEIELADYLECGRKLDEELTYQLRERPMHDEDNARMRRELHKHHARGNLLRFLKDPSIEPTNNFAERMLRPGVIARKVSHCSKNSRGAAAYAAFMSVVQTLKLRKVPSLLDALASLIAPLVPAGK